MATVLIILAVVAAILAVLALVETPYAHRALCVAVLLIAACMVIFLVR